MRNGHLQSSLYTYYFDNFVFEQGCVRRYQTDEGLMINTNTSTTPTATPSFVYHYYLKDHLGNNRVVFHAVNNSPVIDQVNNYYRFGMEYGESAEDQGETTYQNYLFSGKEFDRKFQMNFYDYGFRFYDPALARWSVPDPRAEKYFSYSPYNYCINNPLIFVDPRGDTVKFAGAAEEAAYNNYKNTVNSRVQAYDRRTQKLRDKGKTDRADKRDAKRSDYVYVKIQGELKAAESNENVFRVRMGSNISNPAGDGNVNYNEGTKEIDVNIATGGGWTTMQKVSHEFKHIDQFINLELDLNPVGGGGLLYDKTDEVGAFTRQNLFGTPVDAKSFVEENYSTRRDGPKSFHLMTPAEQIQYKATKYIYNGKK